MTFRFVDLALVCEVSGDLPHARESARLALKTMLEAQGPDHPDIQRYAGLLKRLNKRIEEERREGHEN
jgi:HEPN domain-containing protein